MRRTVFIFSLAAASTITGAQTASKPSTAIHSAAHPVAHPATGVKLAPGIPPARGPIHNAFTVSLRYQDIKVGTGPEGEPSKLWHIKYTGWRAADGVKFDSWDEHRRPVIGKDGKPEMGPDGKPVMGDPEPVALVQGVGQLVIGFDSGLTGMRVGGERRLFIPWQMAYGMRNLPDRGDHPGIPAKSDLIFDVELVDVTELPKMPPPGMPRGMPVPHPAPRPDTNNPPTSAPQPSAPPPSTQAQPQPK